jgi:hypothetical protein
MAFNKKFKFTNTTKNIIPQCKIVVYQWNHDPLSFKTPDSTLSKATPIEVSSQLLNVHFSKSMSSPSGSFSFSLSNSLELGSKDWKDFIKKGSWCVIYMTQDGDLNPNPNVGTPFPIKNASQGKKIRCIGYIERASYKSTTLDTGALDIVFEVSGRDFGIIYEDTSLWQNIFHFEQMLLQNVETSQLNVTSAVTIDKALKLIHDLFFYPLHIHGAKVNNNKSLLEIALQWLLPRNMITDIGFNSNQVKSTPYWGSLPVTHFNETLAGIAVEKPTDFLSGNAWEKLKVISVPELHELFTELDSSGLPKLNFRPIPFAIDKSKYTRVGSKITYYKDLPFITVPAIDVFDVDVGEDSHNRYNSFLLTTSTSLQNNNNNITPLQGSRFPLHIQDSIKRHGFRPMHVTVASIIQNTVRDNGLADLHRLVEFNEVMYDYWNNAVFAESGSVQKVGSNDVKIGMCLKFDDSTPYVNGKRYYIEGYTDTFMIEDKGSMAWSQEVVLTRGFEEQDLLAKSGFLTRASDFEASGEYTPTKVSDKA